MTKRDLSYVVTSKQTANMLKEYMFKSLFDACYKEEDLLKYGLKDPDGNWNKEEIKEDWYKAIEYELYPLAQEFVENVTDRLAEDCLSYIYDNLDEVWEFRKEVWDND